MERKQMYFTINDLLTISLTLVVAGIGIAYGLEVMGDIRDDMEVARNRELLELK